MMNNIILVGKLSTIKEIENGIIISVTIPSRIKNENGEYEYDYVDCYCYGAIADTTKEYCKENDTIGVKGRIRTTYLKGENEMMIIAERITFLSSNPNLKKEDE